MRVPGRGLTFSNLLPDTDEGLPYITALSYYARTRFIVNLLPLLRRASPAAGGLRRVVTVFAGGHEGPVDAGDFAGRRVGLRAARGHLCTMTTLSLAALARRAPDVAFVHNYPGGVDTGLIRPGDGAALQAMRYAFKLYLLFGGMALPECGERHAFLCTSAMYPDGGGGGGGGSGGGGVPLLLDGGGGGGAVVARGVVDDKPGSGVYSVDWDGEAVPPKVHKLIAGYIRDGMLDKVWSHTEDEFERITGSVAI